MQADKKAILSGEESTGRGVEAPEDVRVEGDEMRREEEGGRREEVEKEEAGGLEGVGEEGKEGVAAESAFGLKVSEWPSQKSSMKQRNQGKREKKRTVTFARSVTERLFSMREGPGTRTKRRVAIGSPIGTMVKRLSRPNMEKQLEAEELTQEQIGAILGPFRGAAPVQPPKPTHCRVTCKRGPCRPERCSCKLAGIPCSIDAQCQCKPSNCTTYEEVNPMRDVLLANENWKKMQMPENNVTIRSVDAPDVGEEPVVEAVQVGDEEDSMVIGGVEEDGVMEVEEDLDRDRFVTIRRNRRDANKCDDMVERIGELSIDSAVRTWPLEDLTRRVLVDLSIDGGIDHDIEEHSVAVEEEPTVVVVAPLEEEAEGLEESSRQLVENELVVGGIDHDVSVAVEEEPPIITDAKPVDRFVTRRRARRAVMNDEEKKEKSVELKEFQCYLCGMDFESKNEFQLHVMYHQLKDLGSRMRVLEPTLHFDIATPSREATQVLDAPFITVRRRVQKRKSEEREGEDGEGVESKRRLMEDDEDSMAVEDVVEGSVDSMNHDQMEGFEDDGRSESQESQQTDSENGSDSNEEDEEVVARPVDFISALIPMGRAGIMAMPADEARDLVYAINMTTDPSARKGWIVIGEDDEEDDDDSNHGIRSVMFETFEDIESEVKEVVIDLAEMIAESTMITREWKRNMIERGWMTSDGSGMVGSMERSRFLSNLGRPISQDRIERIDFPVDGVVEDQEESIEDQIHPAILDSYGDQAEYDGDVDGSDAGNGEDLEDGGCSDDGGNDGEDEEETYGDDDDDARIPDKHSINLRSSRIGEEFKKRLPTMLKDEDRKCCLEGFITPNSLMVGLMNEVSAKNRKDIKFGVMSPSVFKDWEEGKPVTKDQIDESLFSRDRKMILIPLFHRSREFEGERIQHWSLCLYDVNAYSVVVYDSVLASKAEREGILRILRGMMSEWLGENAERLRFRFARANHVVIQQGIEKKTSSGLFVLLHARRIVQLEKDVSNRGRSAIDVAGERKRLLRVVETAGKDFRAVAAAAPASDSSDSSRRQQQQPRQNRKRPAVTVPEYIRARRNNNETNEKIKRCCLDLARRC